MLDNGNIINTSASEAVEKLRRYLQMKKITANAPL